MAWPNLFQNKNLEHRNVTRIDVEKKHVEKKHAEKEHLERKHLERNRKLNIRAFFALPATVILPIAYLFFSSTQVRSDDLWRDYNPYSPTGVIATGTVLKLNVSEVVNVEYEFENAIDDRAIVKMVPDRTITDFIPPTNIDKSSIKKTTNKVRSKGSLNFKMAVSVQQITNGVITFTGRKNLESSANQSRQEIVVTGRVNERDLRKNGQISSIDVADLSIQVNGAPIQQNKGYNVKQVPGENNTTQPSAELSNEEKQQLLMDYLNRVLGETRDQ